MEGVLVEQEDHGFNGHEQHHEADDPHGHEPKAVP